MKNQIILFAILLVLFSACKEKKEEVIQTKSKDESIEITKEQLSKLNLDTVKYINQFDELVVVGDISFDEDNIIRVYPIVSGSVSKINVSLGDYVKKGETLARIESTDMNQYQVDYQVAKNNLNTVTFQYNRIKELYQSNFASEKEMNEIENSYKNAQSEYEGKKQLLELYGGELNKKDAIFNVQAPINGYIVERNINEGTQIRTDNNQNIFTISDLKTVWVWANIYESDISKVKAGDSVKVLTIAYPDKPYYGVIKKIGSMLDPQSRIVRVRIDLDNPEELLKPEMFATIEINPKTDNKIIAVPTSSIFIENNEHKIIVQTSNGKYIKKVVKEGKVSKNYTEIIEGVAVGDVIISKGGLFISSAINNK